MNTRIVTSFLCWLLLLASLRAQEIDRSPEFQAPRPSSRFVSEKTSIIVRPGPILDPMSVGDRFIVRGSISGLHAGRTVLARDGKTVLFYPSVPFAPGETVDATLRAGLRSAAGVALPAYSSTFTIGRPPADAGDVLRRISDIPQLQRTAGAAAPEQSKEGSKLNDIPDDLPEIDVTNSSDPSPGLIYLGNFSTDANVQSVPYLLVLNNSGLPHFARRLPDRAVDFKMQSPGLYSYFDGQSSCFLLLDSTYTVIDTFRCGNGYTTDLHDFELLPNGHALLMSYDPETVDMSTVVAHGTPGAVVVGLILQELDESKNVVFEWRSWDHFQVTDATHEDLTTGLIDYVHGNSIEVGPDGNILLSCRHMDEVTKIDRTTGEIIWRLGGKNNQFTFVNDAVGFSHQHDARWLPGGHITLFDNGNFHTPAYSRAVEYRLDEASMTATLVWQYRHVPDIFGQAMGSVQRLPNGNTAIGWGLANPNYTEVNADGQIVQEITFPTSVVSYRSVKFPGPVDMQVTLRVPKNGSSLPADSIDFRWYPADRARAYRIQVSTDSTFSTPAIDTLSDSARFRAPKLDPNENYYWRVASIADAQTPWSEIWSLRTDPARIVLASPVNTAVKVEVSPLLSWKGAPEATSYEVQVDTDPTFPAPVVDDSNVFDAQYQIDRLGYGITYFWRVRVTIDGVTSAWSDIWKFETIPTKEVQTLVSPTNSGVNIEPEPTLEWHPYTDASSYELQVAPLDPRFETTIVDDTLSGTARKIGTLESGTIYYWRVRPIVSGSAGDWSETWYFQTGAGAPVLPPQVTPLIPPDQTTVTSVDSLLFAWNGIGRPGTRYHLEVSLDAPFSNVIVDSTLTDTTAKVARSRFGNATYWWRVSALDSVGQGPFSDGRTFTTEETSRVPDPAAIVVGALAAGITPNPATDEAALRLHLPASSPVTVSLVDARGVAIATVFDGMIDAGEHRITVDLRALPAGLYFCRAVSATGTIVAPLIVTR